MLAFDPGDVGYLRELAEFVAIPSVSRDAAHDTMIAAARWLAGQLGFAGGRVVETGGHPVVRGEWLGAPGAPTILVYGHYDVQPTGDLAEWDITVEGANTDLHSGRYGGTVANPLHALSEIVASLHDPAGTIAVDGFYDGIAGLTAERRRQLAAVPFDEAEYLAGLGLDTPHGEAGFSTLERLWERPTLEINGISGGGKYTVIPHVALAHVSCRLVPGQDPDRVIEAIVAHVGGLAVPGVRVTVRADQARVPAYTIPAGHPAIRAATAALESVYPGEPVLLACIAGTLPATALFERVLGAKTLFFSFSTADEKLHAPNEYLRIRRLREGMRAWEQLWRLLAVGPHRLATTAMSGA